MRYIISDIHGCLEEYLELLEKIQFSDRDMLYILGDTCDRGPEPIRVLQDMLMRPNLVYILGNHDFMFIWAVKLLWKLAESPSEPVFTEDQRLLYQEWLEEGGHTTLNQFMELSREEQEDILDFLEDALLYEVVEAGGKRYVLAHAGIDSYEEGKNLDEYDFADFIFARPNYRKPYFKDESLIMVTGHTPTPLVREDKHPLVYQGNGHIAVDCGCVFGGNLAAFCVETGEVTYVKSKLSSAEVPLC